MSGIDIGKIWNIIWGNSTYATIAILIVLFTFVALNAMGNRSEKLAGAFTLAAQNRPEGTDIKLAGRKDERNNSLSWRDTPVAVNSETITRELGWTLDRYKTYQDNQRREVLTAVPDFGNELHPEELILRWVRLHQDFGAGVIHDWNIILTDKRMLYKFEERQPGGAATPPLVASHWYANIIEVKPEWGGDLGSHVEGGGGYVQGWAWQGTGGAWGQQNPIRTVQHQMYCMLTIRERNGEWLKFPLRQIYNESLLTAARDFVGMLDKLVNLAWKRPSVEVSPARVEAPVQNSRLIESLPAGGNTPSNENRITTLERYAALREKGLITEEEYNQQKKKLLGS